ncbi:MAG TPA: cysteine synthase family protein, partial [Gemmatimonadaceae bacterium]|nr:cysteine synthase family protein [Gemmatimonadaceae bacterium]
MALGSGLPAVGTDAMASLDRLIGNTPLVPLRRVVSRVGAQVLVKLEYFNPGGSVKDRPAREIIRAAERDGRLHGGVTLLDASSGNTGIAYAMLCAARGYRCEICLPGNASAERRKLLRAYGAGVVDTDPLAGSDGAILEARHRAAEAPDQYFYADQYNNPENPRAHYRHTGAEIWTQTHGGVTHFVAALGTSGTFVGTGRRLREYSGAVRLIAVQPDSPLHGIEGTKHMASAIVPGIYDPALADATIVVATEEAQAMTRRLAREEGLLAGVSGGANVAAAVRVAATLGADDMVVTLLP